MPALYRVSSKIETGDHHEKAKWNDNSNGALEPRKEDVIMGRGKKFRDHPGNKLYADLIDDSRDSYFATAAPLEKRSIIVGVVEQILERGGRFLKRDESDIGWVAATKDRACTKTAHAIQYQQRKTSMRSMAAQGYKEASRSLDDKATFLPLVLTPVQQPNRMVPLTIGLSSPPNPIRCPASILSVGILSSELNPNMANHRSVSDETTLLDMGMWLKELLDLEDDQVDFSNAQPQDAVSPTLPQLCNRVSCSVDNLPGYRVEKEGSACVNETTLPPTLADTTELRSGLCCPVAVKSHCAASSWSSATRCTSLGLFRVTSIGSLVSVDEGLGGSMTDLDW